MKKYVLHKCKQCPKDYIGSTINTLRAGVTGHRFAYNHKKMEQPLVKHAESHNEKFEDLYNVIPIRQMKADSTTQELRYMEQAHQMVLKSKFLHGLNLR